MQIDRLDIVELDQAELAKDKAVHAMTDVTGFGLLAGANGARHASLLSPSACRTCAPQ
jgi:hypothetical protein